MRLSVSPTPYLSPLRNGNARVHGGGLRSRLRPSTRLSPTQAIQTPLTDVVVSLDASHTGHSGPPLKEPEWVEDRLTWIRPDASLTRVQAAPNSPPIVVLPGFGNCTADYVAPFVELERKDWFKVARALLTVKFWSSALTTSPGYKWYLDKVDAAVQAALEETGAETVDLICHSAGGWLGRAYLADPDYFPKTNKPAPVVEVASKPSGIFSSFSSIMDSTASAGEEDLVLDGLDEPFPLKQNNPKGVKYVSVCGRTVRGRRDADAPRDNKRPRTPPEYGYDSYQQVCGVGQEVEGDCVVPIDSAFLHGAKQIVLDGVYHSMSRVGTFEEKSSLSSYGTTYHGRHIQLYIRLAYLTSVTSMACPSLLRLDMEPTYGADTSEQTTPSQQHHTGLSSYGPT
eukprot:gene11878-14984_t